MKCGLHLKVRSVTQTLHVPCTSGYQSPHSDRQSNTMTPRKCRKIMTSLQYNRQLLIFHSINQSHNQPHRLCITCYLIVVCTTCYRNNIAPNEGGAIPLIITHTKRAVTRYVVIEPIASYECHRTVTSGREPRARSHTLRVNRASRSDTTSNVKVVQIVYCS